MAMRPSQVGPWVYVRLGPEVVLRLTGGGHTFHIISYHMGYSRSTKPKVHCLFLRRVPVKVPGQRLGTSVGGRGVCVCEKQ